MLQLFLKEYLEAGVVGVLLVFNAVLGVTQPTLARWFGAARRSLKSQLRCVAVGLAAYAYSISMPIAEFIPLLLIAVLATAPVALLATFTLATALSAQKLARLNVLPICLSAIDKAASMNVLSSDKTGTLTRNELAVTAVHAFPGFDEAHVIGLAALASSDGGRDPVDQAVRAAASPVPDLPTLVAFIPFDPATKMSEAKVLDALCA